MLCIVGMPFSGKTIVSDKARQLGIFTLTLDEIVREEMQRKGIIFTHKNKLRIDEWFHENEKELMRRIVDKITSANNPDKMIIEGLRTTRQIKSLNERLIDSNISVLAVYASPMVRLGRGRNMLTNADDVKERDRIEIDRGLPEVISMADHIIVNNGDLLEFRKTVKDKLIDILNIDVKR